MNDNRNNDENLEKSLEEARKKKVDEFQLNFGDSFFDDYNEIKSSKESEKKYNIEAFDYDINLDNSNNSEDEVEKISSYSDENKRKEERLKFEQEIKLAEKEKEKKDKARKKIKAEENKGFFTVLWLLMTIVVGISIGRFAIVGINDLLAVDRKDDTVVSIELTKKDNLDTISSILYKNGIINNEFFFKLYARLTNSADYFSNGTFEISKNKDYEAIINFLQSNQNRMDVVTVQFTEGMTVEEIGKKLEKEEVCDYNEFIELCNSDVFDEDYEFLVNLDKSKKYYKLEGYLFPDTYDFYKNEDAEDSIRRFLANFRNKCIYTKQKVSGFDKKVNIQARAEKMGYTLEEIIILASLIQAEAANNDDMYYVSSVFHNRLNTAENGGYSIYNEYNMLKLESDTTQFYPYTKKTAPKDFESMYDTYKNEGLPSGAVCCPSMEAIYAALMPKETNYYYFCHKSATEDSPAEAYYAETLYQHNINIQEAGLN